MSGSRLTAVLFMASLAAACGPRVDVATAVEVTDVTTGWYDAGVVSGGHNKLVPSVGFRLRNVSNVSLRNLQLNAVFQRVGDTEKWGDSYRQRAVDGNGLAPGASTDPLVLQSNVGYTSEVPRLTMLDHSQFKDARVELFARYGSAQYTKIGEWPIERVMLAR